MTTDLVKHSLLYIKHFNSQLLVTQMHKVFVTKIHKETTTTLTHAVHRKNFELIVEKMHRKYYTRCKESAQRGRNIK